MKYVLWLIVNGIIILFTYSICVVSGRASRQEELNRFRSENSKGE